jgi:hypothetical protein
MNIGVRSLAPLASILLILSMIPSSPASLETFRRSFGGPSPDMARGIAVAPDGTVYLTGWTDSYGSNPPNLYLSIFRPDNTHHCSVAVDLGGAEIGVAVRPHGGKLYVVGSTSSGSNPPNIIATRFDTSCNLEVLKVIDLGGQETPASIAVEPSSPPNFYVVGSQATFGSVIIKLNATLDVVWAKVYKVIGGDDSANAVEFSGGKVYVTGVAVDLSGDRNVYLSVFNPDGSHAGTKMAATSNIEEGRAIAVRGGEIYVAGTALYPGRGFEVLVARFDTSLNLQWARVVGADTAAEAGNSVTVTATGLIYVVGSTSFFGSQDVLIAALSSTGSYSHAFAAATQGPASNEASSAIARGSCVYAAGQNSNWPMYYVALDAAANTLSMTVSTPTLSIASPTWTTSTPTPSTASFAPSLDSTASPDSDSLYMRFCPDTLLVVSTTTSLATQTTTLALTTTITSTTTAYQIATTTLTSIERVTSVERSTTTTTMRTTETERSTIYQTETATVSTTTTITTVSTSSVTQVKTETTTTTIPFAEPVSTYVLPALLVLVAGLLAATLMSRRRRRLIQY